MLDWLIIGGGVHGTYLSHVLMNRLGVGADDLRVLDDAPELLAVWKQRARACAMSHLRSPQAHHLDLRTDSLRRYAGASAQADAFIEPYRRPALSLFEDHTAHVLARHGLGRLRLNGRAYQIEPVSGGYRVSGDAGDLRARRVLLAPGPPAPFRPAWAAGMTHVFDSGFTPDAHVHDRVAVIGGGATGGQLALALAGRGAMVELVARSGLRQADFDSHPCYLGPRCLDGFARAGLARRRRAIVAARQAGTLPREIYANVAAHPGIQVRRGEVAATADGGLRLADGRTLEVDDVVLATGFGADLPGGELVQQAIGSLRLPLADDGWPRLQPDLQWRPGLFAGGRLAELELGPAAGNIAGARMAGRRLAARYAAGVDSIPLRG